MTIFPAKAIDHLPKIPTSSMRSSLLNFWSRLSKRLSKYCELFITISLACLQDIES